MIDGFVITVNLSGPRVWGPTWAELRKSVKPAAFGFGLLRIDLLSMQHTHMSDHVAVLTPIGIYTRR